jgi:hypothetical protein
MTNKITRSKVKKVELTAEDKKAIEKEIDHLVSRYCEPQMASPSHHCEGACPAPTCGSEVAGACPPCP